MLGTGAENALMKAQGKSVPVLSSGARALIRVNGKALAVALDFRWSINIQATEVRTIDTNLPWDIAPNQIQISGTLNQIMDPSDTLEAHALFPTLQSAVHMPLTEIEVLDKTGASLFLARGMFTSCQGQVSRGQLSTISCGFQGSLYQHNVAQDFEPYGLGYDLMEGINVVTGALSNIPVVGSFL